MSKEKSEKKENKPSTLDKKMAKDPNYLKKLELDMLNASGLFEEEKAEEEQQKSERSHKKGKDKRD